MQKFDFDEERFSSQTKHFFAALLGVTQEEMLRYEEKKAFVKTELLYEDGAK